MISKQISNGVKGETRAISERFMAALRGTKDQNGVTTPGLLTPMLDRVKTDETLMLALRGKYINIYYRGGNIIKISEEASHYSGAFNLDYIDGNSVTLRSEIEALQKVKLDNHANVMTWVDAIPRLKLAVDIHLGSKKDKHEREFQQLVARENNSSGISNDTEYFIADIEYAIANPKARFDLLAIQWLAKERKNGSNCRLALIEMKYGVNAFEGDSGLQKHLKDIDNIRNDQEAYNSLLDEMEHVFAQLRDLGLIRFGAGGNMHSVKLDRKADLEVIFLLANHNPRSSKLKSSIDKIVERKGIDLRFFVASSAGYGMHSNCMLSLEKFKELQKFMSQ